MLLSLFSPLDCPQLSYTSGFVFRNSTKCAIILDFPKIAPISNIFSLHLTPWLIASSASFLWTLGITNAARRPKHDFRSVRQCYLFSSFSLCDASLPCQALNPLLVKLLQPFHSVSNMYTYPTPYTHTPHTEFEGFLFPSTHTSGILVGCFKSQGPATTRRKISEMSEWANYLGVKLRLISSVRHGKVAHQIQGVQRKGVAGRQKRARSISCLCWSNTRLWWIQPEGDKCGGRHVEIPGTPLHHTEATSGQLLLFQGPPSPPTVAPRSCLWTDKPLSAMGPLMWSHVYVWFPRNKHISPKSQVQIFQYLTSNFTSWSLENLCKQSF